MSAISIVDGAAASAGRDALAALADAPGTLPLDAVFVAPGDEIYVDHEGGFLKGHGTQLVDGRLLATTCGVVARVNKLVSVRPLKSRYSAETGDVVVGRVTEVAGKRWKLDVNARQEAMLMLSAVTLPGGVQRRRTSVDELNMRTLFAENDLVSAEVQSFFNDGGVALHTRSAKYGRLLRGQLVVVPPVLIKRLKQHFCHLAAHRVDVVLGCNGWVWVQEERAQPSDDGGGGAEQADADAAAVTAAAAAARLDDAPDAWDNEASAGPVSAQARERVCRCAAAVRALSDLFLAVHPDAIAAVADAALAWGVPPRDMGGAAFLRRLAEQQAELAAGGAD